MRKTKFKNHLSKYILSLFLLVIFTACFTIPAYNNVHTQEETASADSVIPIIDELSFITSVFYNANSSVPKTYSLSNDISINVAAWAGRFTDRNLFSKVIANITFLGNNHTITLVGNTAGIDYEDDVYFGLFGRLENSTVSDLIIKGDFRVQYLVNSTHFVFLGPLAGYMQNCNVSNVISKVKTNYYISSAATAYAGGLIGRLANDSRHYIKDVLIDSEAYLNVKTGSATAVAYCGVAIGVASGNIENIAVLGQFIGAHANFTIFRAGGIFGGTASSTKVKYCYFTNGFQASEIYAFPKTNSLTEGVVTCTINDEEVTINSNASFSTNDPYRFSNSDKEEFITTLKAMMFDRQFYAFRLKSNGSRFNYGDDLPMLCWQTRYEGLPIPTALSHFFAPVSQQDAENTYLIENSAQFNDMALGQFFSPNYYDKNMRLTANVEITNDFLPFVEYRNSVFDGGGYSLTVPNDVKIVALKAGIFARIYDSIITNFTFNFYGEFNSALANEALANDTTDPRYFDYEANRQNGAFNHVGLVCYANGSSTEKTASGTEGTYELSRILVDFNGKMEASSKYWSGTDYTTARAGVLVGEDWHNATGNTPIYNNCLINWRGGTIADSAEDSQCNNAKGIYVRLDVGVFWNGNDQNTVAGLSRVWTIAKNAVVENLSSFTSRSSVVTGCLIKEMDQDIVYSGFSNGEMSFYLNAPYNSSAIITNQVLDVNTEVTQAQIMYRTPENNSFDPNLNTTTSQAVLYAYQTCTLTLRRKADDAYTDLSNAMYRKGATVSLTYDSAQNAEGKLFYGYDNVAGLSKTVALSQNRTVTLSYSNIVPSITNATYDGQPAPQMLVTDYGSRTEYSYEQETESGYQSITAPINAGNYRITVKCYSDVTLVGVKTYTYTIDKATITVSPIQEQKVKFADVIDSNADGTIDINDLNIEFVCERKSLLTGALTLEKADNSLEIGTFNIILGSVALLYPENYALSFESGVTYFICNDLIGISIADNVATQKVYDGTSDAQLSYTVTNGAYTGDDLCSLHIGDNYKTGTYQILISNVKAGYEVSLSTAYYTITPKPVTVKVIGGYTREYDKTTNSDITFEAIGLAARDADVDYNLLFTGELSYDGTENALAGGYPITQGTLAAADYVITVDADGHSYTIEQKQVIVTPTTGQSRVYNGANFVGFDYSFTDKDGAAFELPLGDTFTGALTLDCPGGICDVIYNTAGDYEPYEIILGDLSLGDNYSIDITKGIGVTVTPKPVADLTYPDLKEVSYTPSANVRDILRCILGSEILPQDKPLNIQPLYTLYEYDSNGAWVALEVGEKPGVGYYKAVTTGKFTSANYTILEINGAPLEFSVEYTITPYVLTKENFDFPDITTDFSGTTVSVGVGTTERESGYDYPGVELFTASFEDQNNTQSDGLENGVPKYAGVYRQICVFKCSGNYSCVSIGSTSGTDYLEIKRNIVVQKKALNITVKYDGKTEKTTPYLAKTIPISVTAYGNSLQESVSLVKTITMDGLTADSIFYVGTYVIEYTFNSFDGYYIRNYRLSDGTESDESVYRDTFTVTKATPIIKSVSASDISYEAILGTSVITSVVQTPQGGQLTDGSFAFTKPNAVPDAGYYEAEIIYSPTNAYEDKARNVRYKDSYNSVRTTVVVRINPQTVTITPVENSTQEYDEGRLSAIAYTNSAISDKALYGFTGALSAVNTDGSAVTSYAAGKSYRVTLGTLQFVKYTEDGAVPTSNYVLALSPATHTVTPKNVTLSFNDFEALTYDYTRDTLPCTVTSSNPALTVVSDVYVLYNLSQWQKIDYPFDEDGVCGMIDAGYYKLESRTDDTNYRIAPEYALYYFSVERMTLPLDCVKYETTSFDYSGEVRALQVDSTLLPPGLIVSYKNNANVYTGSYSVSVFITSSNKNYSLGGVALSGVDAYEYKPTITINKYRVTQISIANIDELYYTGGKLTLTADFGGVRTEDNVKKTYTITRDGVAAEPIEAGDYVLTVDIQENENYQLAEDCENVVSFTIRKQQLGIQAEQTIIKVYNGNTAAAVTPSMFTLKGIIGEDDVYITDGITANFETESTGVNKQIRLSNIVLGGADKDNYYVNTALITVSGNVEAKRYENTTQNGLDLSVVPIKDSNLPLTATLQTVTEKPDSYKDLKKAFVKTNESIYKMFTFVVRDESGNTLPLTSPVMLSLNTDGSAITIYSMSEDGTCQKVDYTLNGTYAEFNASQYGRYVVTVERVPNNVLAPVFASPLFYVVMAFAISISAAIIVQTAKKRKGGAIRK